MARPRKSGLDYYPLDVNFDKKYRLMRAKFGFAGVGFVDVIHREIYKNSYYLEWDDDFVTLISHAFNSNNADIEMYLQHTIEYLFFDKKIFDQYSILTSAEIQSRFIFASQKRTSINMYKQLMLVDITLHEFSKCPINILDMFSHQNESEMPQRKEEETKRQNIDKLPEQRFSPAMEGFLNDAR
jgi:hypothetical protein